MKTNLLVLNFFVLAAAFLSSCGKSEGDQKGDGDISDLTEITVDADADGDETGDEIAGETETLDEIETDTEGEAIEEISFGDADSSDVFTLVHMRCEQNFPEYGTGQVRQAPKPDYCSQQGNTVFNGPYKSLSETHDAQGCQNWADLLRTLGGISNPPDPLIYLLYLSLGNETMIETYYCSENYGKYLDLNELGFMPFSGRYNDVNNYVCPYFEVTPQDFDNNEIYYCGRPDYCCQTVKRFDLTGSGFTLDKNRPCQAEFDYIEQCRITINNQTQTQFCSKDFTNLPDSFNSNQVFLQQCAAFGTPNYTDFDCATLFDKLKTLTCGQEPANLGFAYESLEECKPANYKYYGAWPNTVKYWTCQ